MANVILDKTLSKGNQSFELRVWYNPQTNEVTEIKSIWLLTHGKRLPVSDLIMAFFEDAINKIIDETDWRKVYRDNRAYDGIDISDLNANIQLSLASFITH